MVMDSLREKTSKIADDITTTIQDVGNMDRDLRSILPESEEELEVDEKNWLEKADEIPVSQENFEKTFKILDSGEVSKAVKFAEKEGFKKHLGDILEIYCKTELYESLELIGDTDEKIQEIGEALQESRSYLKQGNIRKCKEKLHEASELIQALGDQQPVSKAENRLERSRKAAEKIGDEETVKAAEKLESKSGNLSEDFKEVVRDFKAIKSDLKESS